MADRMRRAVGLEEVIAAVGLARQQPIARDQRVQSRRQREAFARMADGGLEQFFQGRRP